MKRELMAGIVIATLLGSSLTGCGSSNTSASAETKKDNKTESKNEVVQQEKPIELIFTSVSVPGDSHTEAMSSFADKVKELSNGSITVKTYHSGSLFSSENEFDALLNGDADMAYISFPNIATQLPSYSMFGSGYFFSSYEHMTDVLNGEIGKNEIRPQIEEELGVVPLSSFYLGSRVINTTKKEINTYNDMSGLLLRMPNSEAWLFLGKALGANPTPLSFSELYTALQTGAVDAQDNPLPSIESAKFYEVTKYIAITNHVIDSLMPSINKETWESMSQAQQQAVIEAIEYARNENDTARLESEANLIKFFEEKGLTITYPDINEFKKEVQAVYAANTEQTSTWDMNLYEKIQAASK